MAHVEKESSLERAGHNNYFLVFFHKADYSSLVKEFTPSFSPPSRPSFLSSSASSMPTCASSFLTLSLLCLLWSRWTAGDSQSPTLIELMVPRFCPRSHSILTETELLNISALQFCHLQNLNRKASHFQGLFTAWKRRYPRELLGARVTCPACFSKGS